MSKSISHPSGFEASAPFDCNFQVRPALPAPDVATIVQSQVLDERARLDRRRLQWLGLACAVSVSSIYYNQPLLLQISEAFHQGPSRIGWVATGTQTGYALGLLFLVPLGDVLDQRRLIRRLFAFLALALALVAVSPTFAILVIATAVAGMMASVTHVMLPIAPEMATDENRGRAIGTVMTGLLLGILLARTFAGWLGKLSGWRSVYVVAAVLNLCCVVLVTARFSRPAVRERLSYQRVMLSMWSLLGAEPLLRDSCIIGSLTFASFSCIWTTLALILQSHYHLGPGATGMFGLMGAAGASIAPFAGKRNDLSGSRSALTLGLATLSFSYLVFWGGELAAVSRVTHLLLLGAGMIVMDIGAQMLQVAHQTRILGLVPLARSRLNTIYMTTYFFGGAVGSWLSTKAWARWQSSGVFSLALSFAALAAIRHLAGPQRPKQRESLCRFGAPTID